MIGRTVSHFQILEKLGQGGMGVVYRALDTSLNRQVALKVLTAECMTDLERKKRFIKEAQAASALNHPNIVTVHEIGSAEGVDFIAMELIRGQPLSTVMDGKRLEPTRALGYAVQVADALNRAHMQGILHRDLKPQNIMITGNDQVKLVDFGLAKLVEPAVSEVIDPADHATVSQMTQPGVIMGTPHYMSPEQAEGKPVDLRSDIFSFGSVLYEMITGRCPFSGTSPAGVLGSILRDRPVPPDDQKGLSLGLWRICEKALEKDREYRYQHMQDLLADLKKLQRDLLPGAVSRSAAVPAKWPRAAAAVLLLILLAVSAALWWRWLRPGRATPPEARLSSLSTFPGSHHAASFSPDGSMIAFVDGSGGRTRILVKNLAQGDPIQITSGDVPADRPRWSPKNDQILFCTGSFFTDRESESIWSVPPLGGTPRQIVDHGRNASLSRDGDKMVFERGEEVWTTNADGTGQRRLDGIPKVSLLLADRYPAFSPDGTRIVFFQSESGPLGDYWIASVEGGQPKRLTHDLCEGGVPVWTPDGGSIVFPSTRAGSLTLWRMQVTGGAPQPLTTGAGADADPELSRDGKKLIFTNARNTYSLRLLDPATSASQELVQTNGRIVAPVFSPDATKIAYFSEPDLFVVDIRDPRPMLLTHGKGQVCKFPHWSPDGSSLYFYQAQPVPAFREIRLNGGQIKDVVPGWAWESEYGARVDPTGQMVVYTKRNQGAITATSIRNLATGSERTLPQALDDPRWSRDGRWIAGYTAANEILVCPADEGTCRRITNGINPVWSADGAQLFFQRRGGLKDGAEIWSISLDGSAERKISDLRPMLPIEPFYDVSVRNQIAWVQFQPGNRQLWLLELAP